MYTHTQNFCQYHTEILQTIVKKTVPGPCTSMEQPKLKIMLHILIIKVGKVTVWKLTVGELASCLTAGFYHGSSTLLLEIQFTDQGNLQLHFYQVT